MNRYTGYVRLGMIVARWRRARRTGPCGTAGHKNWEDAMINRFVRVPFHLAAGLVALCMALLATLPTDATQTNWKITTSGNFSTASNWDNGVPDSTKVADFGLGLGAVSYTVTYSGAPNSFPPPQYQANQLIVSGTNNVTFARNILPVATGLTATSTDTTHATPGLMVGQFSGDNATLNDSILTSVTEAIVGNVQSSTGTLNVSGGGMNYSNLIIGYQGLGAMTISGGTHVTGTGGGGVCWIGYTGNAGNHGQLTVTGAGTTLSASGIYVGPNGSGSSMMISGGAQVSDSNSGYIGFSAGSSGTAIVDGAGSSWASGFLYVGESGTGALQITGGAQVSDGMAIIGDSRGSVGTVTIDGAGSKWTAGQLEIGLDGSATLYVSHGGALVSTGGAVIGDFSNPAFPTVIVDGAGSTWTDGGGLSIANGTLSITGGGMVSSSGDANIGTGQFSIASATVDGAGTAWTITGGLTLGSSSGNGTTGTLTVRNGGVVSASSPISIAAHGTLKGDGTISGAVSNGGIVAPGATIGALHITGSYSQFSVGTLQIELAGTTPGAQFDRLAVSASVTLGGALNVSLINGFIPAGTSFDILDWGSLSGVFNSIQLPALPNGLQWNTSQLYTTGVLSVGIPGDFNGNGVVDAADYVVWRKGLGTIYNQNDYTAWRSRFGQSGGSGAGASVNTAVPEPATLALLMFAAAGWCLRRRGVA
jgi:T5SS/PEP-CTERM-associated repeat protein